MATSDNLPLPNCDSDGKAENMRQRTVVWLIYHQSECLEEVIFVNFPCASEVVSRQGVSVDPPARVALARRVVFIREFKIRRLRTTATDKYATAHDQNHVTVHFSRVVLRLR